MLVGRRTNGRSSRTWTASTANWPRRSSRKRWLRWIYCNSSRVRLNCRNRHTWGSCCVPLRLYQAAWTWPMPLLDCLRFGQRLGSRVHENKGQWNRLICLRSPMRGAVAEVVAQLEIIKLQLQGLRIKVVLASSLSSRGARPKETRYRHNKTVKLAKKY